MWAASLFQSWAWHPASVCGSVVSEAGEPDSRRWPPVRLSGSAGLTRALMSAILPTHFFGLFRTRPQSGLSRSRAVGFLAASQQQERHPALELAAVPGWRCPGCADGRRAAEGPRGVRRGSPFSGNATVQMMRRLEPAQLRSAPGLVWGGLLSCSFSQRHCVTVFLLRPGHRPPLGPPSFT